MAATAGGRPDLAVAVGRPHIPRTTSAWRQPGAA
jgi:hypothetical protein